MSEAERPSSRSRHSQRDGIEALAWLTDVAGLSRDDATDLMRWSGRALLLSAIAEKESDADAI